MKQDSVQRLDIPSEPIKLDRPSRSGSRGFVAFLICCSVLIAAFAISGTWGINDLSQPNGNDGNGGGVSDGTISATNERAEATSPAPVIPDGATPIVDQHTTYGGILLNETIYAPDMEALRAIKITVGKDALKKDQPLVLILHTHAQEAYLPQDRKSVV